MPNTKGDGMSRIKGRYVALVTLDFSATRDENTYPLEKIRNSICGGELSKDIRCILSDRIATASVTVDQQFADVYEVEGKQDETD